MKNNSQKNPKSVRVPLKIYYAKSSVTMLGIACLLACLFVFTGVKLLYSDNNIPVNYAIGINVLVCFLTAFNAICLLIYVAGNFIKPIEKVNEAVKKVTDGDFTIQIDGSTNKIKIDELETLTENFNKMTSELNGMDYMRKDFISNISHEIKTPISAITGFTEILQDASLPEKERAEYLKLVNEEASRLSRLCENMLRMSRLDNQEIVTRREKINVSEQLRKTVILMAEKWESKNQEFDISLEELEITSDPDLLLQMWINLIDNAIKYSDDGAVIHISGRTENGAIVVTVKDEGIGIPEEKIGHIFDKFYQCDESHKKQGNGLGLSIVKRIVDILNGEIECQSEVGAGTMFTVKLEDKLR